MPARVGGLSDVTAVAAGYRHSLAIKSDHTVWAWGYNRFGQLGNGTGTDSSVPVQVTGLNQVVAVAAGYMHSLAITSDRNECGRGDSNDSRAAWATGRLDYQHAHATPMPDPGSEQRYGHSRPPAATTSLAVKSDGTVWAWGYERGLRSS